MINFLKKRFESFKKSVASVLVFSIIFSLIFSATFGMVFQPKKAEAILWNPINQAGDFFAGDLPELLQKIMDFVVAFFSKNLMDYIVDEIIGWINGEGDPKFVTDWQGFVQDIGDEAAGEFLNELSGTNLCNVDWRTTFRISLSKPKRFASKYECTFSKIGANFDDFMDDFNNGGWKGWIAVTESQNNPYSVYLGALDERNRQMEEAKEAAKNNALSGGGYLGDSKCVNLEYCSNGSCSSYSGSYTKEQVADLSKNSEYDGDSYKCTKWEAVTPGKTIGDMATKALTKDIDWLQNKDKWQSYVVAIVDALINRVVREGMTAWTSNNKSSSGFSSSDDGVSQNVAPVVQLAVADPWKIKFELVSSGMNSNANDAKSTDIMNLLFSMETTGSGKSIQCETDIEKKKEKEKETGEFGDGFKEVAEKSIPKIKFPGVIVITPPSPSDIKEGMEKDMEILKSKFGEKIDDTTKNLSEKGSLTGVNSEVKVFYTLDGTDPKIVAPTDLSVQSSKLYTCPIELSSPTTIKWLAVNAAGLQSPIGVRAINPPFSNTILSTVPAAVDINSIVIRANMPTTVYYTTNGSVPTTASKVFTDKIELPVNVPTTVRWFGVDQNMNQEPIHTRIFTPPFPGKDFQKMGYFSNSRTLVYAYGLSLENI